MPERRLTVSRLVEPAGDRYYPGTPDRVVPYLRMRGRWLERLGFEVGSAVRVTASPGRLVVELRGEAEVAP